MKLLYKILKTENLNISSPVVIDTFYKASTDKGNENQKGFDLKSIKKDSNTYRIIKENLKKIQNLRDVIIKTANLESEHIIKEAKNKIEELKIEANKNGYEEGFNKGYKEGLEKGIKDGNKKTSDILNEAKDIKRSIINERNNLEKQFECDMVDTILKCVNKIIGDNLKLKNEYIVELIKKGLNNYEASDVVTARVCDDDYEYCIKNKDRIIKNLGYIKELNIVKDLSLKKGDCIINTPSGLIDSGITTQLKELEVSLKGVINEQ